MAAVERQLLDLPRFSGASVTDDEPAGAVLVTHPGRGPGANFYGRIRWPADEVDARLSALRRRFAAMGEWPSLLVAGGLATPVDLGQRLGAAGWAEIETERIMWSRRPPVVPHLDPSTRLEGVTRRTVDEYEHLEREIFGLAETWSAERADGLMDAVERSEMRAFLVRLHGEAIAVARVALGQHVAGLYGIGVAPRRRRQGYGALVTAIATRSALATGDRLAWLSVSERNEAAVGLYAALGYRPSFSWSRWLAPPS